VVQNDRGNPGAAGIDGFLGNLEAFSAKADEETSTWKLFARAWWDEHRNDHITMDQIFRLAETLLPQVVGDGQEKSQRIKLGKALSKRIGWRFRIKPSRTDELLEVELNREVVRDAKGHERHQWSLVVCAPPASATLEEPLDLGGKGEGIENTKDYEALGLPPSAPGSRRLGANIGDRINPGLPSSSDASPRVPLVEVQVTPTRMDGYIYAEPDEVEF